MWDSISLNNQGELACSLVMGIVFVVHIAWDRPPVCFGWVWWDHPKHTEGMSQAIFHMYLYMFVAHPHTGQVTGKNFDACTAQL